MGRPWRLRVDWVKCEGYGTCADMAPDLVGLDDWGYPVLLAEPLPGGRLTDAQRAADCCPEKALILERVPEPRQ